MSIYTRNDAGDANDPENIGGISRDDITAAVLERVRQAASRRNLDFIGPDRGGVIPMEISLGGLIGEALSHADETSDFLSEYVDELLAGGDDDIANISHALLEQLHVLVAGQLSGGRGVIHRLSSAEAWPFTAGRKPIPLWADCGAGRR